MTVQHQFQTLIFDITAKYSISCFYVSNMLGNLFTFGNLPRTEPLKPTAHDNALCMTFTVSVKFLGSFCRNWKPFLQCWLKQLSQEHGKDI